MPTRAQTLAVVLLLWAAIYLPGLGSLPIKGEEGRRILPAISMLQTGNYLVPEVGGATYFSKPPLINWLIAISFKTFGVRNEWTARLPSALAILVVAIAFVTIARTALSPSRSVVAAVVWLTCAGIIEKGRLAEIEAVYVSLCALALIWWLSFLKTKNSMWMIWIPTSIFLGLGLLTKGPVHLIFFYGVAISTAWQMRNWRLLFHPAHFIGILVMIGIFAAWAVPFVHGTSGEVVARKWTSQFSGRLKGTEFNFSSWIFNIPRGLAYLLPWTIFLPLIHFSRLSEEDRPFARALAWGAAVPFVFLNLIPGSLPRYSMPALIPACFSMAMIFCQSSPPKWPTWLGGKTFSIELRQRTVLAIPLITAVVMNIFAFTMVPLLQGRQNIKGLAAQIDNAVPPNESVYAFDPRYQPLFFYLKRTVIYADNLDEVPRQADYLLTRPERAGEVLAGSRWAPRRPRIVLKLTDYRQQSVILFKIDPGG